MPEEPSGLRGETLHTGSLLGLRGLLDEVGVALEAVLAELGLSPRLFDTPEGVLAAADAGRLLERCAQITRCPHLGLRLAQTVTPPELGLPGLLMQSCPTVGAALKSLTMTLHFSSRAVIPVLSVHGQTAMFDVALMPGVTEGRSIGRDLSLAIACGLVRTLVGPAWIPAEVWLARRAPVDRRPYRQFFGVDPKFDAETSALLFPASVLDSPVRVSDRAARQQLEHLLTRRATTDAEFLLFCRRAIVTALVRQDFSVATVAGLLKLHRRTLNRRLAALGTSVTDQLRDIRFALARELLADTTLPIADIAVALGYSETATFSRSFRGWSGQSPSDWRATSGLAKAA